MVLRRSVAFCILVMLEVVSGDFAIAHEIRPAYLQITEVGKGEANYHILWKQPVVQNRRLPVDPVFRMSASCSIFRLQKSLARRYFITGKPDAI